MFEFVSSLGSNLGLCTFLLLNDNKTVGAAPKRDQHLDAFRIHESEVVNERAARDQTNLLTRSQAVILSGKSSDEDRQLTKCLSGRLHQHLTGVVQWSSWDIESSSLRRVQSLGSGSAAMVHKSRWVAGQMEVAEKVFYGSDHPSFMNEARVLAGLAHPNIVPLLGYAVDEDKCSVVMELMDGDLLFHIEARLQENASRKIPFTNFEAVDMMLQTAEGMLYLHENKVVHGDLKSLNILMKRRKDVDGEYIYLKVADFGLSKTKESNSTYSTQTPNTGTTRWMAPELMTMGADDSLGRTSNHDRQLTYPFKVDVYSFGMVCYEILSGRVPFSTISSLSTVKEMVLKGDRPVLPDHCPQPLKTLIHSCWDSEASLRPSFVEICKRLRSLRYSLLTGQEMGTERKKSKNICIKIIGKSLEHSTSEYFDASEELSETVISGDAMSPYRTLYSQRSRPPTSPYRTLYSQRDRRPKASPRFIGVRLRKGVRGYLAEIRPPKWKRTIWLGTYKTDRAAAGAYDAGTFYANKKTKYNFPHLKGTFPPLPPHLSVDNAEGLDEIKMFIQHQARMAAQKAGEESAGRRDHCNVIIQGVCR